MSRRFQFTLRALLLTMLGVAIACAIWVNLPVAVRVAIVAVPSAVLAWLFEWDVLELLWGLLPPYDSGRPSSGPRYVIKRRERRGKQEVD